MNREILNQIKELGIYTFPIKKNTKFPNVPKGHMEKLYKGEVRELPIDDNDNFGVIGSDNFLVIDFDKSTLLDEFFPNREELYKNTVVVESGKGHHVYINCPGAQNRKVFRGNDEIDLKGPGGYCVGPSSTYIPTAKDAAEGKYDDEIYKRGGFVYKLLSNPGKLMELPWDKLVEQLEQKGFKVKGRTSVKEIKKNGVSEGSRNDSLFKYLAELRGTMEMDDLELSEMAHTFNKGKINPPLSEEEVDNIVASVCSRIEVGGDLIKTKSGKKRRKKNEDEEDEEKEIVILRDKALDVIERMILIPNGSEVYVSVYENGILNNFSLSSKKAIYWLSSLDDNDVHTESFYKTILLNLEAKARNEKCNKQHVYTRIAQVDDTIWYDLGNDDWEAVKISPNNVEIVKLDIDSPMFRRPNNVYEQVNPIYDSDMKALDKFSEFLKIKDKTIFKVHIVSSFFEQMSKPMMILGGEAGSYKTTITSFVKRLIDPSGPVNDDNIFSLQENHDDLIIFMDKRYVPAFDNVGYVKNDISDIFCRAVTGGANQKRQLYSNDDETLFSYKRMIIMNGVDMNPEQTDFLSRMITYGRNQQVHGRNEIELENDFKEMLPYVLGEIFHLISEVIGKKPIIKPRFRLTDFETTGDLIARELGIDDFQDIYSKKRSEVDNMGMENHPIVRALNDLLKSKNDIPIKMQTFEMYNTLADIHKDTTADKRLDENFPKAPNKLYGEIEKTKALQRALKVNVTRTIENGNKTYLTITRIAENSLGYD